MLGIVPGPNAVFEWTQEWIQTLNQADEDKPPTFNVVESPPGHRHKRRDSWDSHGESILRNGYQKKRSVSWSKTIQVQTFQDSESRDDVPESESEESESDESYDDLQINLSNTMDDGGAENRDFDAVGDDVADIKKTDIVCEDAAYNTVTENTDAVNAEVADKRESGDGNPNEKRILPPSSPSEESEDVFAQIEVSYSGASVNAPYKISTDQSNEDVFDLVAASSTISEFTMEGITAPTDHEPITHSSEKVKPSNIFTPVLLPSNFRLENRLDTTDSGSFCTLSEDDRSLISNMDETASLVARRAASDDESIVNLRRRKEEYDDTKQREIDGVLGHLGINLPLPSMKNFWSAMLANEVLCTSEAASFDMKGSNAEGDYTEVHRTGSISEASIEDLLPIKKSMSDGDGSDDVDSDMATLSKDVSMSQDELGNAWHIQNAKKKKSKFRRFSLNRKKTAGFNEVPSNTVPSIKKRGLFNRRRKKSKAAAPQLLVC